MPSHLRRYQHSGQSHFLTFSCYRRRPNFTEATRYDLFVTCVQDMRRKFEMYIYGYVVMPEHVHLLVSEPERETLATAIHYLKLSFAKRMPRAGAHAGAGAPGSRPLWDANLGGSETPPRFAAVHKIPGMGLILRPHHYRAVLTAYAVAYTAHVRLPPLFSFTKQRDLRANGAAGDACGSQPREHRCGKLDGSAHAASVRSRHSDCLGA